MDAKNLIDRLVADGAGLFTGVPDSLLSKFSACVMLQPGLRHLVAANEGNAIGLAIGDYLSTGRPSVVYMQNSGLGNTVNPITSLADPLVYGIPMFLVIGWRGEPDVKDEPQHIKQGAVTLGQLDVLDIPYAILSSDNPSLDAVDSLWQTMLFRKGPVALVVRKDALTGDYPVLKKDNGSHLTREKAIELITGNFTENAVYVATTGKAGRELYEIRERQGGKQRDFLTVGGMGHASSIALGIALNQPDRWTVCLDGDGALILHMGAMSTIAASKPEKFLHVLLNNYAHESVGGQSTHADIIDFKKLSEAVGYTGYQSVQTEEEVVSALSSIQGQSGVWLLEIRVSQGARKDLGRPKNTPAINKQNVMAYLKTGEP